MVRNLDQKDHLVLFLMLSWSGIINHHIHLFSMMSCYILLLFYHKCVIVQFIVKTDTMMHGWSGGGGGGPDGMMMGGPGMNKP